VRVENICNFPPVVIVKVSGTAAVRTLPAVGGNETWVMGLESGDGMSCCERKLRQYLCSGVTGDGPEGSLRGCRAVTGAAMAERYLWMLSRRGDDDCEFGKILYYLHKRTDIPVGLKTPFSPRTSLAVGSEKQS